MLVIGLEPINQKVTDFESAASTIPPYKQYVMYKQYVIYILKYTIFIDCYDTS